MKPDLLTTRGTRIITGKESNLRVTFVIFLLISCFWLKASPISASPSVSIQLEDFRWTSFPLYVLVDMNEWSKAEYAVSVHEALDTWRVSTWEYSNLFNDTTLAAISFVFFVSNVNSTGDYDIYVTFSANEMPLASGIVGETTTKWKPITHEPDPPVTINITTYSTTASSLFVKNIALHELGHALGLGHALSQNTDDGPELMYARSARVQEIYPSTLDVYGLTRLYLGSFGRLAQLPASIPYKMLSEKSPAPPVVASMDFWRTWYEFMAVLTMILIALLLGLILRKVRKDRLRAGRSENPIDLAKPAQAVCCCGVKNSCHNNTLHL